MILYVSYSLQYRRLYTSSCIYIQPGPLRGPSSDTPILQRPVSNRYLGLAIRGCSAHAGRCSTLRLDSILTTGCIVNLIHNVGIVDVRSHISSVMTSTRSKVSWESRDHVRYHQRNLTISFRSASVIGLSLPDMAEVRSESVMFASHAADRIPYTSRRYVWTSSESSSILDTWSSCWALVAAAMVKRLYKSTCRCLSNGP